MPEDKIRVIKEEDLEDLIEGNSEDITEESRAKLTSKVLFQVCIGILAVFGLMLIINSFIALNAFEQKTAYYLSILASNSLFILLIVLIKTNNKITWVELGWQKTNLKTAVKDVFKIWGLTWLIHIIYMLIIILMGITPQGNELIYLLEKPSLLSLLVNILLIAVAAPFIEETLFRGLLFGGLRTYFGCWTAITISAVIFSALHLELIGFFPRFMLGVGLGYLYVKHKSLYPAIGLHALNNLIAVLIVSLLSS